MCYRANQEISSVCLQLATASHIIPSQISLMDAKTKQFPSIYASMKGGGGGGVEILVIALKKLGIFMKNSFIARYFEILHDCLSYVNYCSHFSCF